MENRRLEFSASLFEYGIPAVHDGQAWGTLVRKKVRSQMRNGENVEQSSSGSRCIDCFLTACLCVYETGTDELRLIKNS